MSGLCLIIITTIITTTIISTRKDARIIETIAPPAITSTTTAMPTNPTKPSTGELCHMTLASPHEIYPVGDNAKSLIVDDLNKDSFLDVIVSNCDNDTISILFGNGDGTFQKQQIYATGNQTCPWELASGDFDNDGFVDIGNQSSIQGVQSRLYRSS